MNKRNIKTYLGLILYSGLTGGYNFYLNKDKKAIRMMTILILSLFLIWDEKIWLIGVIGIFLNIVIVIKDLINSNKDIIKYNKNIEELLRLNNGYEEFLKFKTKSTNIYIVNVLLFSIIGLDELYLEDFKIKSILSFIINALYLILIILISITVSLSTIYTIIAHPEMGMELVGLNFENLRLYIGTVTLLIMIFIVVHKRCFLFFIKLAIKLSNAECIVSDYNNSISLEILKDIIGE